MSNPVSGAIIQIRANPLKALIIGLMFGLLLFLIDAKTKGGVKKQLVTIPGVGQYFIG